MLISCLVILMNIKELMIIKTKIKIIDLSRVKYDTAK